MGSLKNRSYLNYSSLFHELYLVLCKISFKCQKLWNEEIECSFINKFAPSRAFLYCIDFFSSREKHVVTFKSLGSGVETQVVRSDLLVTAQLDYSWSDNVIRCNFDFSLDDVILTWTWDWNEATLHFTWINSVNFT